MRYLTWQYRRRYILEAHGWRDLLRASKRLEIRIVYQLLRHRMRNLAIIGIVGLIQCRLPFVVFRPAVLLVQARGLTSLQGQLIRLRFLSRLILPFVVFHLPLIEVREVRNDDWHGQGDGQHTRDGTRSTDDFAQGCSRNVVTVADGGHRDDSEPERVRNGEKLIVRLVLRKILFVGGKTVDRRRTCREPGGHRRGCSRGRRTRIVRFDEIHERRKNDDDDEEEEHQEKQFLPRCQKGQGEHLEALKRRCEEDCTLYDQTDRMTKISRERTAALS